MRRLMLSLVTTLLTVGAIAAIGSPARAVPDEPRKTKVELSSGTIAIGAGGKRVTFTVTNITDQPLRDVVVGLNQESYDSSQVSLGIAQNEDFCDPGPVMTTECPLTTNPLLPGRSAKLNLSMLVKSTAVPGPAGTLVVWMRYAPAGSQGDTFEFPLSVSAAKSPDLFIQAYDVPVDGSTIKPGEKARAKYVLANYGAAAAKNMQVRLTLPDGASIDRSGLSLLKHCTAKGRTATCSIDQVLVPHDHVHAFFPIELDKDAELGVNLTGRIEVIRSEVATEAESRSAVAAEAVADIDESDNRVRFQILVAPRPTTGGGGGGEDDPTLPITGPVAASIAGFGVVLLAAGALLVLSTRRRRRG